MFSDVLNVLNLCNFHISVISLSQTRSILLPKNFLQILKITLAQNQLFLKVIPHALHLLCWLLNPNLSTIILSLIELVNSVEQCIRKPLLLVTGKHKELGDSSLELVLNEVVKQFLV